MAIGQRGIKEYPALHERVNEALQLMVAQRVEESKAVCLEIAASDGYQPLDYLCAGQTLRDLGFLEDAVRAYERVISCADSIVAKMAHGELGYVYKKRAEAVPKGRDAHAIALYRAAREHLTTALEGETGQNNAITSLVSLIEVSTELGEFDRAQELIRVALVARETIHKEGQERALGFAIAKYIHYRSHGTRLNLSAQEPYN